MTPIKDTAYLSRRPNKTKVNLDLMKPPTADTQNNGKDAARKMETVTQQHYNKDQNLVLETLYLG